MPQLIFKGKSIIQGHHFSVPYHELIPYPGKSLTEEVRLNDNVIIHGDNLAALKALMPTHAGRVKLIYIDPPYNTGQERWIYNDNVNSPMMQEWLGKVVDREDLTRHDKWLCMMYPRLQLLRDLLDDDGFIFISIDQFEIAHLRPIMDEIFGSDNHRSTIAVRRGIKNVQAQFKDLQALAVGHEYVLMYSKRPETRVPKLTYPLDEANAGKWDTFWRGTDRPTMRYPLFGQHPDSGQWRWEPNRAAKAKENYEEFLRVHDETGISLDDYYGYHLQSTNEKLDFVRLNEEGVVQYFVPPTDVRLISDNWMDLTIGGNLTSFDTEKSVGFVQRIIKWMCPEGNEIVLDSFAGSGTTGHAVLDLNRQDGKQRRFILVELEDYADRVTAQRIRHVVQGSGLKRSVEQCPGTFSYFQLGRPIDEMGLLTGDTLPPYEELARYVFYTATGEHFNPDQLDESRYFVGESSGYEVYLIYQPDLEFLQRHALTLDFAEALPEYHGKKRLVFAPAKLLRDEYLAQYHLEYARMPFDIFRERR